MAHRLVDLRIPTTPRGSIDLSGSGLSLAGALRVCDAFLAATDDIPKRAQALVAGVYDVLMGEMDLAARGEGLARDGYAPLEAWLPKP